MPAWTAVGWSAFVGLFMLGGTLISHGARAHSSGKQWAGGVVIAALMGWNAYVAHPELGWSPAVALPMAMLAGGLLHVGGRRVGSLVASAGGLGAVILAGWWSVRPVLEVGWEPRSLEVAVRGTGLGWPLVGLVLLIVAGERLRRGDWSGWILYGRGQLVGSAAMGMLVFTPAVLAVLVNVGR
ncbi:MAG: hypothetical protein ACRDKA_14715 [Actinomycetota bacterium]